MPETSPETESLPAGLVGCLNALDDRKAERPVLLNVQGLSTITDYLLIVTGNSDPHLRALVNATTRELKSENIDILGAEFTPGSGWAVVDAFEFMVHIFKAEDRDNFQLEAFWKDAKRIDTKALIGQKSTEIS